MKNKFNYFLIMALAVCSIAFTSCDEDEDIVAAGDDISIALSATSATVKEDSVFSIAAVIKSDKNLDSVYYTVDGGAISGLVLAEDMADRKNVAYGQVYTPLVAKTETITVVAVDRTGTKQTATIALTVEANTTALSEKQALTIQRVGSAAASGPLPTLGLAYESNSATSAIIKKGADKLVKLDATLAKAVTTVEAMKALIDGADDIDQFTDVSVEESKEYDLWIGTINGTDYYLIHITKGTITSGTAGTTVKIEGAYLTDPASLPSTGAGA